MTMEMYFVYGLLCFMLAVVLLESERVLSPFLIRLRGLLWRLARRCEKRCPYWCDGGNSFYSFFRRDSFHTP